jgi:hypothetical protein
MTVLGRRLRSDGPYRSITEAIWVYFAMAILGRRLLTRTPLYHRMTLHGLLTRIALVSIPTLRVHLVQLPAGALLAGMQAGR